MRIGFEAKRLFTNYTGLGNYSRFVVNALSSYNPGNEYFLYTPKHVANSEVSEIVRNQNIEVIRPTGVYRCLPSLWRSWGLSKTRSAKRLDIFHGLSQELPYGLPSGVKKVVTVHDLIFLRYPDFYNKMDVSIYKAKVTTACDRADRIIAISNQTAQDVVDFLKVDPDKVQVVYQGCHPNFKRRTTAEERERVKIKYNLPGTFILNVGTIEKRKNTSILIEAMSLLPDSLQIPLVIIGRGSRYMQEIIELAGKRNILHKVHFIHKASFADFPAIYQQASMFVYPSLFEGFGIPLLEAIASGIPVITSQGSCFSEAAGPDSLYINPHAPEELARKIQFVLNDAHREDRIDRSRMYIRKFEPAVIVQQLDHLYRSLVDVTTPSYT